MRSIRRKSLWLIAVAAVAPSFVCAAPAEEPRTFMLPQNRVAQCHVRFDKDGNLLIDSNCKPDIISQGISKKPPVANRPRSSIDEKLDQAQRDWRTRHKVQVVEPPMPAPKAPGPCDTPKLFIRADSIDNFAYQAVPAAADAKGASVSYTNDQFGHKQTATIAGMVSYVMGEPCLTTPPGHDSFLSGYVIAPWVYGNGTWNQPAKKGDSSAAKGGISLQAEIARASLFDVQYFSATPYYQTDFVAKARVEGLYLYWEPHRQDWHLGSTRVSNDYFAWFWQFRGESDVRDVQDPGLTNLAKGNYEWLGSTARLNIFLFPLATDVPAFLQDRISLIGTAQYYWDVHSSTQVHKYSAQIKYKLAPCQAPDKTTEANSVAAACTIAGSSSISLQYDWGTDKDTLVKANKYLVKLDYAY